MYHDIHNLPVEQGGGDNLTAVLQFLEVSGYGMGEVWDPNSRPLHLAVGPLVEFFCNLLYPQPYQVWEEVVT